MDTPEDKTPDTRMKLLPGDVEELGGYLDTVPRRQPHSTREAIRMLMPKIIAVQKKGYSIADIATMIQGKGFDLPVNTLRAYVGIEGRKDEPLAGVAAARSEQATPVKAQEPQPGKRDKKARGGTSKPEPSRVNANIDNSSAKTNPEDRSTGMHSGTFEPRADRKSI